MQVLCQEACLQEPCILTRKINNPALSSRMSSLVSDKRKKYSPPWSSDSRKHSRFGDFTLEKIPTRPPK